MGERLVRADDSRSRRQVPRHTQAELSRQHYLLCNLDLDILGYIVDTAVVRIHISVCNVKRLSSFERLWSIKRLWGIKRLCSVKRIHDAKCFCWIKCICNVKRLRSIQRLRSIKPLGSIKCLRRIERFCSIKCVVPDICVRPIRLQCQHLMLHRLGNSNLRMAE